jgi:hypothetical protein
VIRTSRAHWIVLLCFLTACAPSDDQAATVGQFLLQSLAYARQMADTAMIQEIFQPDATYDDYPGQVEYRGIEEIVGYLTEVHEWGDDVYLNLGNVLSGPSGAVGEWFFSAVQSRPIPDVMSRGTDREVGLSGITLIEIVGGRIARAADYFDRASLMLQLGGRIEMPDGTVIDLPEN